MTPSRPAARRERERAEMRELILQAAMKLFAEEGFQRTTMRRIADEIEYAAGAIYSYFADKDEILYALHERGFEMMFEHQAHCAGIADPFERLREIGRTYLTFAMQHPQYYDLMFMDMCPARVMEREKQEWEPGMKVYGQLLQTVTECIATGRIARTEPAVAAFACWSQAHGMVSLVLRQRCSMIPPEQREPMMQAALDYLMRRLA